MLLLHTEGILQNTADPDADKATNEDLKSHSESRP